MLSCTATPSEGCFRMPAGCHCPKPGLALSELGPVSLRIHTSKFLIIHCFLKNNIAKFIFSYQYLAPGDSFWKVILRPCRKCAPGFEGVRKAFCAVVVCWEHRSLPRGLQGAWFIRMSWISGVSCSSKFSLLFSVKSRN